MRRNRTIVTALVLLVVAVAPLLWAAVTRPQAPTMPAGGPIQVAGAAETPRPTTSAAASPKASPGDSASPAPPRAQPTLRDATRRVDPPVRAQPPSDPRGRADPGDDGDDDDDDDDDDEEDDDDD